MHLILCILILAHSILSTLILMDGIKKAKLVLVALVGIIAVYVPLER